MWIRRETDQDRSRKVNGLQRWNVAQWSIYGLLFLGVAPARADLLVTKNGSVNPDGSTSLPFHVVESAIGRAQCMPNSTINVEAGRYRETFSTGTPCVITATGGTAVIGNLSAVASTTLSVVTLNTHLFGHGLFVPNWQDQPRAEDIGRRLNGSGVDVVAFQEMWDEYMLLGGSGHGEQHGDGIFNIAHYNLSIHGSMRFSGGCVLPPFLNSGLAVMSLHASGGFAQFSFGSTCTGCLPTDCSPDCLASKGWLTFRFTKDNFPILVVDTHTQAGGGGDEANTRAAQIRMLASSVQAIRTSAPGVLVIVMGDMNIPGETAEYANTLVASFGPLGGRDADRNAPGFDCDGSPIYTLGTDNELAQWFEDDIDFGCGVQVTNQRLDYVFYFPPLDGSMDVVPREVAVMPFRGPNRCENGFCSDESSDHYGVSGMFDLYRIR